MKGSYLAVCLLLAITLLIPAAHHAGQVWPSSPSISSAPDFTIQVTPDSMTVGHNPGLSANITVTSTNNFAGTVNLASTASLPTGPGPKSVTLAPNSTATSILFFDTYFVAPGDYPVNITGTSGLLEHWTILNIHLVGPDFQIRSSQTTLTEVPGGLIQNASQITVTSVDNFSGPLRFFAYTLGPFIQTQFSPGTINLPANGTATTELTIIGSQPGAQPGTYSLIVGATGGQSPVSLTHSTTIQLTIRHKIGPTVTTRSISINSTGIQATVTVKFSTSDPDGTIQSVNIYWGDGTNSYNLPGSTTAQTHLYNSHGTFTITITARDSSGAISAPATETFTLGGSNRNFTPLTFSFLSWIVYAVIGALAAGGAVIILVYLLVIRRRRPPVPKTNEISNRT